MRYSRLPADSGTRIRLNRLTPGLAKRYATSGCASNYPSQLIVLFKTVSYLKRSTVRGLTVHPELVEG